MGNIKGSEGRKTAVGTRREKNTSRESAGHLIVPSLADLEKRMDRTVSEFVAG